MLHYVQLVVATSVRLLFGVGQVECNVFLELFFLLCVLAFLNYADESREVEPSEIQKTVKFWTVKPKQIPKRF